MNPPQSLITSAVVKESITATSAAFDAAIKTQDHGALAQATADMQELLNKYTVVSKIFSCAWADDRVLLAGTKDNKLLRWTFDRNFAVRSSACPTRSTKPRSPATTASP